MGNVFTTHTPVAAAFDCFPPDLLTRFAPPFAEEVGISVDALLALGRRNPADQDEPFNMAYLAMRGSGFVNGVSALHGRVSRRLFAGLFPSWPPWEVPVASITNGVHIPTWDSAEANVLWASAYEKGRWMDDLPEAARAVEQKVSDEALWDFRASSRKRLIEYVRARSKRQVQERGGPSEIADRADRILDPNALTLGFARRFTEYKRPTLLLADPQRLRSILCHPARPVQLIVAGKAHPNDSHGKSMVLEMARFARQHDVWDRVVFLQDYDMVVAEHLAAGVDVWVNTPRRPAEACGTSGMKMLVNGGVNLSVLDGWWDEAYSPDAGWAIGGGREHDGSGDAEDARELYALLESQIVPEFYDRDLENIPRAWLRRVRASMTRLTEPFSSDRMVREYAERFYVPAARAFADRSGDGAELARDLEAWHERIESHWWGIETGELVATPAPGGWRYEAQVILGAVQPKDVAVQLFAEPERDREEPMVTTMTLERPVHGAINGYVYSATIETSRPPDHFTPRIVPHHPNAMTPLECARVTWCSHSARVVEAARSNEPAPASSPVAKPA